jgi:hypothetical protein
MTAGAGDEHDLTSPPSRRLPRFDLRPLVGGLHSLRFWGALPATWAAHLSLGLARDGVGIARGEARRRDGRWEGELHLRATPGGPPPEGLDYVRMLSRRGPAPALVAIEPVEHRVRPLLGTLALEVSGRDCLGFLGGLLARLAVLSLFPEEMRLETYEGRAVDHFRLKALGSRTPSLDAARALDRLLHDLGSSSRHSLVNE